MRKGATTVQNENYYTGKTVEEALNKGLEELGLTEDKVSYEVIEKEKKGLFGIGFTPAKIKIVYSVKKDGSKIAVDYVKTILDDLNINADVTFEKTSSGRYKLSVNGDNAGVLIGHHGDTLDSLQYLVNLAVNKREEDSEKGEYMNITVDVENYREKREEALRSLARRMAAKVLKYKKSVALEPMLPYERRIIHSEIQNIEGVSTNSIGVDSNRRVVIYSEEVGFQRTFERAERGEKSGRFGDRRKRDDRASNGERRSSRPAPKKRGDVVLPKIEKKPAVKIEVDEYDESDYSSTAYLREPTKRFSSFAEYESHMAELAANGGKAPEEAKNESNSDADAE